MINLYFVSSCLIEYVHNVLIIVFSCWHSAILLDRIFKCVTFDATCQFYSCVALVFIVRNLCHMRFIYDIFWCYSLTHLITSSRVGSVVHRLFHNPNLLCLFCLATPLARMATPTPGLWALVRDTWQCYHMRWCSIHNESKICLTQTIMLADN